MMNRRCFASLGVGTRSSILSQFITVFIVITSLSLKANAQARYYQHGEIILPDPVYTPGGVMTTNLSDICRSGYSDEVRYVPPSMKQQVCARYGLNDQSCPNGESVEIDHLIPLVLGGSNDIENLWPEPYDPQPGAREKDAVEMWLRGQVCQAENPLSLATAQEIIAYDWVIAYDAMQQGRDLAETNAATGRDLMGLLTWSTLWNFDHTHAVGDAFLQNVALRPRNELGSNLEGSPIAESASDSRRIHEPDSIFASASFLEQEKKPDEGLTPLPPPKRPELPPPEIPPPDLRKMAIRTFTTLWCKAADAANAAPPEDKKDLSDAEKIAAQAAEQTFNQAQTGSSWVGDELLQEIANDAEAKARTEQTAADDISDGKKQGTKEDIKQHRDEAKHERKKAELIKKELELRERLRAK